MSTGIPEAEINKLKLLPLVVAPGTGGEACLKKCNLDFKKARICYSLLVATSL